MMFESPKKKKGPKKNPKTKKFKNPYVYDRIIIKLRECLGAHLGSLESILDLHN